MKELRLDGIIGDIFNTAEDFAYRLDELNLESGDELTVKLNSPGGSVFDGFSIFNQLKSLDNKVTIRIEGLAASIASLIALAGDHVSMTEVGSFMIHRASTMAVGNTEDLESVADSLKQIDDTLVNVYATKTGLDRSEVEEMMDKETWMNPKTALEKGFIDELEETLKAVAFLYSNQKLNMKKLDALFTKLGLVKNETEEESPPAGTEAETEVNQEEEEEEEEKKKEEEEESAQEEEEKKEEEDETNESARYDELVALIEGLIEKVNQQDETLSALNNGMQDFVDNRVKQIAKGIKSNGQVPSGQGTFNKGGTPAYSLGHEKFRAEMAEIDRKAKEKLNK